MLIVHFGRKKVIEKNFKANQSATQNYRITLYTLTSVCIFSILFSIHFLRADKENLFNDQELL